jgi:hypothetical protein
MHPSQSERPMPSWRDSLQKHLADDPRHDPTSPEQAKRAERRRKARVAAKETGKGALGALADVIIGVLTPWG